MKMCKAIPMFILLFTGYLCNNMNVAAESTTLSDTLPLKTTPPSHSVSTASEVPQAPESEAPPHESDHIPEKHLPTLVSGISISFVFLLSVVIIAVWCARKKSKGSSAEINSVPSGGKKKGKSSQL